MKSLDSGLLRALSGGIFAGDSTVLIWAFFRIVKRVFRVDLVGKLLLLLRAIVICAIPAVMAL
jgi:hypothetical protein